jgi:hypothetical protein
MHQAYGGVVPELASRDHIRRVLPLARRCWPRPAARWPMWMWWPTRAGPGLAGRAAGGRRRGLRAGRGAGQAGAGRAPPGRAPAVALPGRPAPEFPFVALLVSGGHTQLMRVDGWGATRCWARPSTTPPARPSTRAPSCWAWATPGGPALARLAELATRGLRAAAAAAAQRRPGLFVRRPEDGGDDAAPQAGRSPERAAAPTWPPAPGGHRGGAGGQVAEGAQGHRGSSGWWWPVAWAPTGCCARSWMPPARSAACGALPAAGAVHRQRRHDRAGRCHAACRHGRRCKGPQGDYAFDVKPRWPLTRKSGFRLIRRVVGSTPPAGGHSRMISDGAAGAAPAWPASASARRAPALPNWRLRRSILRQLVGGLYCASLRAGSGCAPRCPRCRRSGLRGPRRGRPA